MQAALLPPLSIGFVSLIGLVIMAPVSSFTARYGALLAHRMPKRQLEVGFGVFLTGYVLAALALIVRQERFPLYSRSMLVRSLATAVMQAGLWLILPQATGLIIGFCAGLAMQAALLWWSIRHVRWRRSTATHRRAVTARYKRQVLTDIPSTLIAGAVLNIMTVLILDLYSREQVGYYSLAFRIAVLPLTLISGSLSDVFFQKASAAYRATGTFWNELRFNVVISGALSVFIFAPLGLLAKPIFAFALGSRWIPAADMLVLLLPMLMVRFVSATIQTAPLVIGRARFLLLQHLGLLAAILATYAAARTFSWPIDAYVLLTSVLMATVYACYVAFVSLTVRNRAT